jgi:hypothetical protein
VVLRAVLSGQEVFMNRRRLIACVLGVGLCLGSAWSVTYALEQACSLDFPYVSGGMGSTEREALYKERSSYNLWLTMAAKGSGAYLADVNVRIRDIRLQQPVLSHALAGPWLFVNLPVGRYDVEASYRESPEQPPQIRKRTVTLQPGSHRQLVLRFDVNRDTP